ncbi:DUF3152 domain-containing protein [Aestuariimicrobium soli]|uniref:DUF3152 domain-containing protein n=1 Tax=Aestuariimicrobium soli TaxID=2035834 RepID=UPI003EBA3F39
MTPRTRRAARLGLARLLTVAALTCTSVAMLTGCSGVGRALTGGQPGASAQTDDTAEDDSPEGIVRSGQRGSGKFNVAQLSIPPAKRGSRVIRYVVRVEQGVPIKPNDAGRQIQAILDDPRGWKSTRTKPTAGSSFWLVSDPRDADFTISIAAPPTVDALCPLDTGGIWSCDDGQHVLINSDRWQFLTPTYSDPTAYRAYMINHEVGHFLGLGHAECAGAGLTAPVMMQQSKGLKGCVANPWPTRSNS